MSSVQTTAARSRRRELPSFVERLLNFAHFEEDTQEVRRLKRVAVGALWVAFIPNTSFTIVLFTGGTPYAGATLLPLNFVFLGTLLGMRYRRTWWPGIFHFLIAANLAVLVVMALLLGGIAESGANPVWGFAAVLGAVVAFRDRRAVAWLIFYIVLLVAVEILTGFVSPRYELPGAGLQAAATIASVAAFVFLVMLYFVRQADDLKAESDQLLRNVLPDEIADRLKRSDRMIADHFEETSILFADVVDFTPMSAEMSPAETVELLNDVFSAFDAMVEEAGLEKIKTIGDEYMVAAGVPHARPDHARALADLALTMRDTVASTDFGGRRLSFRIGINSGPVVAGIIGRHKFAYDLWGDAVNTASRMESHGRPGVIQISENTYRLIDSEFMCEDGGVIEVKGKGRISVWHLIGRNETTGTS